eukprot:tig00000681_g3132.t1
MHARLLKRKRLLLECEDGPDGGDERRRSFKDAMRTYEALVASTPRMMTVEEARQSFIDHHKERLTKDTATRLADLYVRLGRACAPEKLLGAPSGAAAADDE